MEARKIKGRFQIYWMDEIEFTQEFVDACNRLHGQPGVYCFWLDDVPLYIGKSGNLGSRIPSSYSDKHDIYVPRDIRVSWVETGYSDAGILELYYISKYKPMLNKKDKYADDVTLCVGPIPDLFINRRIEIIEKRP